MLEETGEGAKVISIATARAAQALCAGKDARDIAAAAGIFAILGHSRDALAQGRPTAAPVVTDVEGLRLVAAQDIANFKDAPSFGSVTIPGGGRGYLLGRISLVGGVGAELKLEPHKPMEV